MPNIIYTGYLDRDALIERFGLQDNSGRISKLDLILVDLARQKNQNSRRPCLLQGLKVDVKLIRNGPETSVLVAADSLPVVARMIGPLARPAAARTAVVSPVLPVAEHGGEWLVSEEVEAAIGADCDSAFRMVSAGRSGSADPNTVDFPCGTVLVREMTRRGGKVPRLHYHRGSLPVLKILSTASPAEWLDDVELARRLGIPTSSVRFRSLCRNARLSLNSGKPLMAGGREIGVRFYQGRNNSFCLSWSAASVEVLIASMVGPRLDTDIRPFEFGKRVLAALGNTASAESAYAILFDEISAKVERGETPVVDGVVFSAAIKGVPGPKWRPALYFVESDFPKFVGLLRARLDEVAERERDFDEGPSNAM
jgi:hypothetical protein